MDKFFENLKKYPGYWALIVFFGQGVVWAVHFWDDLMFVMDVVTYENVSKFEALWLDYEKRMGE